MEQPIKRTVSGWDIPTTMLEEWKVAFPQVDVAVEIARAHCWCKANPTRARMRNWTRFLYNWFSRAQPMAKTESNFR